MARSCDILRRHCVEGIEADEKRCRAHLDDSTATATALLTCLSYEAVCRLVEIAAESGRSVKQCAIELGLAASAGAEQVGPLRA